MKIDEIIKLANEEKWNFKKLYLTLKKAKVTKYKVNISNLETTYYNGTKIIFLTPSKVQVPFIVSNIFNKNNIEEIIKNHQINKTSYLDFIKNISSNGCDHYVVDMHNEECIYFNKDETKNHIEKINFL